jgi:hypothetical protein
VSIHDVYSSGLCSERDIGGEDEDVDSAILWWKEKKLKYVGNTYEHFVWLYERTKLSETMLSSHAFFSSLFLSLVAWLELLFYSSTMWTSLSNVTVIFSLSLSLVFLLYYSMMSAMSPTLMIWKTAISVFVKKNNNNVLVIVSILFPLLLCMLYVYEACKIDNSMNSIVVLCCFSMFTMNLSIQFVR